jgi:hypothetical protein
MVLTHPDTASVLSFLEQSLTKAPSVVLYVRASGRLRTSRN